MENQIPASIREAIEEAFRGRTHLRTGAVARLFGVDGKTIRALSDANRIGHAVPMRSHRFYTKEDVLTFYRGVYACPSTDRNAKTGRSEALISFSTTRSKSRAKRSPGAFTGQPDKRLSAAARKFEDQHRKLAGSGQLGALMTVAEGTQRYLDEVAIGAATSNASRQQELCMGELRRFFGEDTLLCAIEPDDVASAAAERARTPLTKLKRLGNFTRKRDRSPDHSSGYAWRETKRYPAPATINRQLIEPLRRLLRRAKKHWGVPIDLEKFQWGGRDGIKREEPEGRTRELSATEEVRRSGLRLIPSIVTWWSFSSSRGSVNRSGSILRRRKIDLTAGTLTYRLLKKRRMEIVTNEMTERELEIVTQAHKESPEDCRLPLSRRSRKVRAIERRVEK